MKRNIPNNWTEDECKQAIEQLLTESNVRFSKNQFDEAARMLVMAARIMKEIPTRRRKEIKRTSVNEKIKDNRNKQQKKFEAPPERPVDGGGPSNPFKPTGN